MYSNGVTLNASSYKTLFSGSSGSLYVPVKPSAVIYSQFSYVHGTAAGNGEPSVSLDKVKILNSLINRLVNMKQKSAAESDSENFDSMSEQEKDKLIQSYQQQIKSALAAASQTGYGFAGLMPEAGSIISISV